MTTTATTDPWAVRDHDPTSITEPMTGTGDIDTTTKALAFARADVHAAAAADDSHQRRQHAHSALAHATTVLTAPTPPTHNAGTPATTSTTRWR
jgi:hypothetical protein